VRVRRASLRTQGGCWRSKLEPGTAIAGPVALPAGGSGGEPFNPSADPIRCAGSQPKSTLPL